MKFYIVCDYRENFESQLSDYINLYTTISNRKFTAYIF